MNALTISQPFASLIVTGTKWVENRTWETKYCGLLAIHAGKGQQYLGANELKRYPTGAFIGVATLVACVSLADLRKMPSTYRFPVSRKSAAELLTHTHTEGPYCWILANPVGFPPIPCRGAQGLWLPPLDVIRQIRSAARL